MARKIMDDEKKAAMSENETEHPTQDTGDSAPDASAVTENGDSKVPPKPDVSGISQDEEISPSKDAYFKEVLKDPYYCADFLNQNVFNGEKRVSHEGISYLTKEINYISPKTLKLIKRLPDVSVLSVVHRNDRESTCFLIFIIESQSVVDYSMAARLMVETGLHYLAQYDKLRLDEYHVEYSKWVNRPNKEDKTPPPTRKHGARAGDKLHGVVPIVFFQDSGNWTAPLDIFTQLEEDNKSYKKLIPNFFYHVITPSSMDDDKLDNYETALGKAIKIIKHSNDWDAIKAMTAEDSFYKNMEHTLFQFAMASVFPTISVDFYDAENDEGGYDMCEAMKQGFEELYGDRLKKELAQGQENTMSLVRQVRSELKKGTPKEEICSKLGVDMPFVEDCM